MFKKLLVASIFSAAVVACSSTQPPVVDAPTTEPVAEPSPMPVASAPEVASAPVASSNHNSVYFGFNEYDIKEGYNGVVRANSDYLATSAPAKVQVEGNTDDIGSVEYNLALGQKRADAVKKALIAGGASSAQVEATSNGKLKPKYSNDTDADRAQNRRADIVYKAEEPKGYSEDSNGLPMIDGNVYSGSVGEGVQ